jgi:serine/threonine-protein kinase
MSPEQLRGEKLDYRSDIFSLGIVLYELLCKQNPFNRKSQAETIAAILSDNFISAEKVTPKLPLKIANLINRCLEKDKDKRFQSTAEILVELENTNAVKDIGFWIDKYLRLNRYWLLILSLVFLLMFGGLIYFNHPATIRTFAVLPIINESKDAENNYLGEGLTEGLINKFTKFTGLKIKASTIVSKYKGQDIDPITIGKDLNVEVVMTGKIFNRENSTFFQTNLIDAKTGDLVWNNEFLLDKNNLINIQDEILTQVISRLGVNPNAEETRFLDKVRKTFPEAEEQLFLGQYYLNHRDRTNIDRAIIYFKKAIEIDPRYAEAWSGLADSYVFKSSPAYGSLTPRDSINKAKAAVEQALQLDAGLGEAYNTLGLIELKYDWNWEKAENNFLKSIQLKPNYAQPHYWYSHLLILKKDFAKARVEAEKASELDPLSPNNEINVGRIYYYEKQNDKAIRIFSLILQDDPVNRSAAYMLGLTYIQKGSYQDAAKLFEKFYENDHLYFAAPLGYTYGRLNRKADAQRILGELEELSENGEVIPPQEKAIIYLGLGDKEKAIELFRSSCKDRFGSFPFVLTESVFDDIRSTPEFIALENCVQPTN